MKAVLFLLTLICFEVSARDYIKQTLDGPEFHSYDTFGNSRSIVASALVKKLALRGLENEKNKRKVEQFKYVRIVDDEIVLL